MGLNSRTVWLVTCEQCIPEHVHEPPVPDCQSCSLLSPQSPQNHHHAPPLLMTIHNTNYRHSTECNVLQSAGRFLITISNLNFSKKIWQCSHAWDKSKIQDFTISEAGFLKGRNPSCRPTNSVIELQWKLKFKKLANTLHSSTKEKMLSYSFHVNLSVQFADISILYKLMYNETDQSYRNSWCSISQWLQTTHQLQ